MQIGRKHIRDTAIGLVGAVVGVVILDPVGQFWVAYWQERGVYDHPGRTLNAAAEALHAVAASAAFHWCGGIAIGFAVGVWLDALLRKRERRALIVPGRPEADGGPSRPWSSRLAGIASIQHAHVHDDAMRITLTDIVAPGSRLALVLSTVRVDQHSVVKDFHTKPNEYVYTSTLGGPDVKDHSIALTPPLSDDPTKPAAIEITLNHLTDTKRHATVRFEASGFDIAGRHFMNSGTGALLATRASITAIEILVQWGNIAEGRVDVRQLNPSELP